MLCIKRLALVYGPIYSSCTVRIKKDVFYSPFVFHAFHLLCSESVLEKKSFYNEMLLFVETQKCPKYFCEPMVCNKWTGCCFKGFYFVFMEMVNYIKKNVDFFCLFVLFKCDWRWIKKAKTPFDMWNKRQKSFETMVLFSSSVCFREKLHVHIDLWSGEHVFSRRCHGLICQGLFIQHSFDPLLSMPSSVSCTLFLFMCNVFRYLDYKQDMPFQCTLDVVYVFQSLFNSLKI